MSYLQDVAEFIRTKGLLEPGQPVVVGVSGGPDSLCLMDVLRRLGHTLVVGHFDHGLRPESQDEARRVGEMAAERSLAFETERWGVGGENHPAAGSLEAAAREARYRFLLRIATNRGIDRVATGHTADDQVETVLMNLLRGAGPDGLSGMAPLTPIGRWQEFDSLEASRVRLARPLLGLWRRDTESYCRRHGLSPVIDPSNRDQRFLRNRVRHDLLATLEDYNPEVREALLRTSNIMADVAEYLDEELRYIWDACVREAGESALAIDADTFVRQPKALQRRLLRKVLQDLGVDVREAGWDVVEKGRTAMFRGEPTRLTLAGGLLLERVGDVFLLAPPDAEPDFPAFPLLPCAGGPTDLPETGKVPLAAGWQLAVDRFDAGGKTWNVLPDSQTAVFDAHQLPHNLQMRSPAAGERFAPLGMQGRAKLSDLFVDRKVPRRVRARWPLVTCGDEILWVVGLRRGELAPVTDATRRVIVLRVISPEEDSTSQLEVPGN
jgi:tRNA(Ile)-lysidine synthetase-like protein